MYTLLQLRLRLRPRLRLWLRLRLRLQLTPPPYAPSGVRVCCGSPPVRSISPRYSLIRKSTPSASFTWWGADTQTRQQQHKQWQQQ
jgi:hypothetical protein